MSQECDAGAKKKNPKQKNNCNLRSPQNKLNVNVKRNNHLHLVFVGQTIPRILHPVLNTEF